MVMFPCIQYLHLASLSLSWLESSAMSRARNIYHKIEHKCFRELPEKLKVISWDMGTLHIVASKLPNLKSEPKFLYSHIKARDCGIMGLPIFNSIF